MVRILTLTIILATRGKRFFAAKLSWKRVKKRVLKNKNFRACSQVYPGNDNSRMRIKLPLQNMAARVELGDLAVSVSPPYCIHGKSNPVLINH